MTDSTQYLRPFSGFLPTPGNGYRLMGPPNSKLTREERRKAAEDPLSFRHTLGKKANSTHEEAQSWISERVKEGVLDPVEDVLIVYRQIDRGIIAWGVIGDVSLAAYDAGLIKRHEATISKSEKRMISYMNSTRVFGNPVALTHRPQGRVSDLVVECGGRKPDLPLKASDGSSHDLWLIGGEEASSFCRELRGPLYVTDGHHRLAAASSLAAGERRQGFLPAAIFDTSQLRLGSFARCLRSMPLSPEALLAAIASDHRITESEPSDAIPEKRGQIGARVGSRYVKIDIASHLVPDDVSESLDANLLQNLILQPLLGVEDPRNDPRVEFIEATTEFDKDEYPAWFLPHPESVDSVLEIADEGLTMPPKSTLFFPKVPAGIAIRYVEDGS